MKPTPTPRKSRLRNNSSIRCCAGLVIALTALGEARAQAPGKPLTQDELLRQIESLNPAPNGGARRTPATPSDAPRAEVRGASAPASGQPLFSEQKPGKSDKPGKPEKRSKGPTEIVALEATFDQKAHLAVFIGDVVVTDPEFNVQSDKLTAYLKHDDQPVGEAPASRLKAGAPPVADASGDTKKKKSGGLEKAIAEADPGRRVTVTQEKEEADGSISHSIGHGTKVVFDSITGDITLTGRPDVKQGINTCAATDDGTIMILNRDGHMRVTGPHKTVISDQSGLTK